MKKKNTLMYFLILILIFIIIIIALIFYFKLFAKESCRNHLPQGQQKHDHLNKFIRKPLWNTHNFISHHLPSNSINHLPDPGCPYLRSYPEKMIGYLVPKNIAKGNSQLKEFSIFNLFQKQIDQSGYRFEYYIKFDQSIVYLIDPQNHKICQKNENPNGCNDFQSGDTVKLDINDHEYIVNLY